MAIENWKEERAGSIFAGPVRSSIPAIPARFEQAAAAYPQRVAIGTGSWQPTYAQLNAAADSFASELRAGCAPGGRVALLQHLDGFLIGSILGVLKAGQVVAVLNAADPLSRLQQNLLEVEPWIIVADPASHELARQAAPPGVPVTIFPKALDTSVPFSAPRASNDPEDLAFLIQTSGSTGRSKRVMQTQPSVLFQADQHNAEMRIQPDDRILLLAAPTGSMAMATIFCALLYGAAICPFPVAEKGIIGLGEWIRQHDITVYSSVASAFRHFLKTLQPDERFPLVRIVKLGGEPILGAELRATAEHFREDCIYYNSYGCAEVGNIMRKRISSDDSLSGSGLPLGNPAANTEVSLLDERGLPTADGEVGEIVVRSKFLSPGYWRDEGRTAERFGEATSDGTRSYRTGDLGRREPDGTLSYVGRRDDMVKIRGNRVILGEVEQNIKSLPEVQESAVLARTLPDGSVRLAAFVVVHADGDAGKVPTVETIRTALTSLLPNYMVPGEFVFLDRLPLNAGGKVDRAALLARTVPDAAPFRPDELATPAEVLLSDIWNEVFGECAGPQTNFFDLGGDSLNAGVVAAKVHAAVGVELGMLDFVGHPRISELARRIDELRRVGAEPRLPLVERTPQGSPCELSFTQENIWRNCQQSAEAHRNYTVTRSYGLRGPLNAEALRDAMTIVTRRNEILRTTFSIADGKPVQVVHPPEPVALPLVDLSGYSDARERGFALLREEAKRPLDLGRGPLVQHKLIRIGPEEHWLVRLGHHILYDAWSWRVYFQQLETAYESILKGFPPASEANGLQYGDYATWERRVFSPGSKFRSQLVNWWKGALANGPSRMEMPFRRRSHSWDVLRREPKPSDGWLWSGLDPAVRARLGELARRESTTDYGIGLAAFAALLAVITRGNRVLLGTYVTNRGSVATQNMLGDFARLLPLSLEYPRAGSFLEWLSVVRKQIAEAQAHAQLPRDELWEDLRSQGVTPPELDIIFRAPGLVLPDKFSGLDFRLHSHRFKSTGSEEQWMQAMPWGFTLTLDLRNEENQCELTFDARIFDRTKVRSLFESYLRLLDGLSLAPDQPMEKMVRAALKG